MNKNTILIIAVILIAAAGAGGFFAGMTYQKTQRPSFTSGQFTRGNGQFAQRSGGGAGVSRPVTGEIVSADDTSITVKAADGSTKIVILSKSTIINKAATGSKSDLAKGEKVAAFGSANSDGSITAQSIQLNPMIRIGGAPK